PGPGVDALTVGELAQRAAAGVVGRARHRAVHPFRGGVLADPGIGITRSLAGGVLALRAAHAGLEHLGVGEPGEADRELVSDRVAGLEVGGLLLHQYAALERGPRHLVLLRRGVVFGVERERRPVTG